MTTDQRNRQPRGPGGLRNRVMTLGLLLQPPRRSGAFLLGRSAPLPGGQLGTPPLLTATPVVSHSPHRSCNNFTGPAGKIVILHRRRSVSGYLLVQRTFRRLPLSLLREVFVFFFLGHELSPLMFGRYHSQTLIPQIRSHRSFSLGRKTLLQGHKGRTGADARREPAQAPLGGPPLGGPPLAGPAGLFDKSD
jgi:hypothetical protein